MLYEEFVAINNNIKEGLKNSPYAGNILTVERVEKDVVYFTNGKSCKLPVLVDSIGVRKQGCISNPSKLKAYIGSEPRAKKFDVEGFLAENMSDNRKSVVEYKYEPKSNQLYIQYFDYSDKDNYVGVFDVKTGNFKRLFLAKNAGEFYIYEDRAYFITVDTYYVSRDRAHYAEIYMYDLTTGGVKYKSIKTMIRVDNTQHKVITSRYICLCFSEINSNSVEAYLIDLKEFTARGIAIYSGAIEGAGLYNSRKHKEIIYRGYNVFVCNYLGCKVVKEEHIRNGVLINFELLYEYQPTEIYNGEPSRAYGKKVKHKFNYSLTIYDDDRKPGLKCIVPEGQSVCFKYPYEV